MKMPRSQCESENIQFVQELAEVDGPFESPININFRDLTKLELPSLVWNRGDTCPKKMKITNTGHTVIISGKWKCERPYLTGGPLAGKYVFSQIHFHWGQDDCRGSEHLVCGDGFPLEMHVAHFKTEYLTQEAALREKDGMVVVVYLFKLQDEPNQSLKKIINLLPCVKQPSTSHAVDPRPILSFCNPFTDDYFMYWGSVVTSTCAHILLWVICREPFGISREQVNEFRKIMDSCQQPICRNSRDVQPLHRRNVFHVNASKHLEDPLLPIKNILGCYCKESRESVNAQQSQDCKCQFPLQNQEEVEGSIVEYTSGSRCLYTGGMKGLHLEADLPSGCFTNQTIFVQRATIQSMSVLLKRFGSEPMRSNRHPENSRQYKFNHQYQSKLLSKSCCFFPLNECRNIKTDKRKPRGKRPFNSVNAFSQIMHSLEALKNQTYKKLKEIESINQEIKGMKPFCRDNEDKRWLRKIEKIMKRQKRLTVKSSQGCFSELKKLARDYNFDKIFDFKALPISENSGRLLWLYNDEITKENITISNSPKENPVKEILSSKHLSVGRAIKFSAKAHKLIRSFFEDIQDSDELSETVKKDLNLKKIKSICSKQAGDSNSVSSVIKGYITQNMFVLGNLGDRFFTEVTAEDFQNEENQSENTNQPENLLELQQIIQAEKMSNNYRDQKTNEKDELDVERNQDESCKNKNEELIPLRRASIPIVLSKTSAEPNQTRETLLHEDLCCLTDEQKPISESEILTDTETPHKRKKSKNQAEKFSPKLVYTQDEECYESTIDKMMRVKGEPNVHRSSSNLSTESTETQRMIIAKFRKRHSRKDSGEENSSIPGRKSYMSLYRKKSCRQFEGYYIQKKNQKIKRKKKQKGGKIKRKSSSSREESRVKISKSNWKSLTKAKFKIEIEKTSNSFVDLAFENSIISPNRKNLKLDSHNVSARTPREHSQVYSTHEETRIDDQKNVQALSKKKKPTANEQDESLKKKHHRVAPKDLIRTSPGKTPRASSVDSKTSYREKTETNGQFYSAFQTRNKTWKHKYMGTKSVFKSRSLTTATITPRISSESNQRLYLESLDRRKNNKEAIELRKQLESSKKPEGRSQIKNDPNRGTSSENKQSDGAQQQNDTNCTPKTKEKRELESSNKPDFNVGFLTTVSGQVDQELLPKGQAQNVEVTHAVLKRCDAEKYHFLKKGPQEQNISFQESAEEHPGILHQTDSNKSFAKDASKSGADLANIGSKDLQTSVSYGTLKKNCPSRPHSAESLNSHKKTFKRKSKKRPHCCKRISRHYIRKNSSIFRKPNKTESKPINFLSLADQEQLKIISVNVAKYLKKKLIEDNNGPQHEKNCSIEGTEEPAFTKSSPTAQEKKEVTSPKEVTTVQDFVKSSTKDLEKTKQNKIPTAKLKEKKKEKLIGAEGKLKAKPICLKTNEPKNEHLVCVSPKPVNNFIKLNKQMAGKYKKRTAPSPEENHNKEKPKDQKTKKQKPPPEAATKTETPKFKTKIPKKRIEKNFAQKAPPEHFTNRPETPSSLKNQKVPPTRNVKKESHIKGPISSKKADPKNKKSPKDLPTEVNNAEESRESVVSEQNIKETPESRALQKNPPEKITPTCGPTDLPSPSEMVENKNKDIRSSLGLGNTISGSYSSEVLYDSKEKLLDGNEDLFKKELEHFIKLEMHLDDISTNIENSMTYVKPTLGQDLSGSSLIENTSMDDHEPYSKEVVLLKMKDVESSTSDSDFVEDPDKYILASDLKISVNDEFTTSKEIPTVKIPKESGDPGVITPTLAQHERQEEANSDSSYDYNISITLNTTFNMDGEPAQKSTEEKPQTSEERDGKMSGYDSYGCQTENSCSQTPTCLEDSSSQSIVVKQHRRKRKDNEISLEMKHKLLEILKGEIRREVGIKCGGSSGNSSDGLTVKWDDSDGNNRSQSTESSCDNIEVLTQISDTMKQYLKNLKEKGQLVERINESSDKESK